MVESVLLENAIWDVDLEILRRRSRPRLKAVILMVWYGMVWYVRLSPTQWLPVLLAFDFGYLGAPTESSEAATPLLMGLGCTRRVCFRPH